MASLVTFPGIDFITGARMTLSRGAWPSVGTITMLPQDGLFDLGPQTMTWASDAGTLQFPLCTLDVAHLRKREDGPRNTWRWDVTVFDRRRYWQNYTVDGDFNRRQSNGKVIEATKKNAQELASFLLNGMGESGDVSGMPTNVYPRLQGPVNAAAYLAWLCEYCSCAIGFSTSGTVQIVPYGIGNDLPTQYRINPSWPFAIGNAPATLFAVGGPTIYQSRLKLEAVALDDDSSKISRMEDATWTPSSGLEYEHPWAFLNVSESDRWQALLSGWSWFRATGQADGSLGVPGCSASVGDIRQILPLRERIVSPATDEDGSSHPFAYPRLLRGDYWPMGDVAYGIEDKPWPGKFSVLADRGLVQTEYPVFTFDSAGHVAAPSLYLTAAYSVQDYTTGQYDRVSSSRGAGGSYGVKVLVRPEVFGTYSQYYGSSNALGGSDDTRSTAIAELDAYLSAFATRWSTSAATQGEEAEYDQFQACPLDGLLAQITLEYGYGRPPRMRVSRGYEHDIFNESFEQSLRKLTTLRLESEVIRE